MILSHSVFLQYVKSCLLNERTEVNSDCEIEKIFQEHM